MRDTRFPPQPKEIITPLYPSKTLSISKNSASLERILSLHYEAQESEILLCNKGSAALFLFLKWLRHQYSHPQKIALPAFCCPEVCQAIILAGFSPVFLDFTSSLTFSCESIEYAVQIGCCALIWPQLFQERSLSVTSREAIRKKGLLLINDEAQLFPHSSPNECKAPITLFSFGHSKRLAAVGGGGICLHDQQIPLKEIKKISRHIKVSRIKNFLIGKIKNYFTHSRKLERKLDDLLEKNPFIKSCLYLTPISDDQKRIAEVSIGQYENQKQQFQTDICRLRRLVPAKSLSLIDKNNPSAVAIRLPNQDRYEISKKLADFGIQTTWYYFPLNRLSFLQQYASEETPNTEKISSELLILPFQWRHTLHQREHLFYALRKTFG